MPSIEWNKRWGEELIRFQNMRNEQKYYGIEWGNPESEPALIKIKNHFVLPFIKNEHVALEIGPGGGRWTQYLLGFNRLYCIDINDEFFPYLKKRFESNNNLIFIQNQGIDFPDIQSYSIDYLFSFGTFVHLDVEIIREYIKNMKQILKKDANVVLNYSEIKKPKSAANKGFSKNTAEIMHKIIEKEGFSISDEDVVSHHTNIVIFSQKN